jgi:hypothetical protein
MALMTERQAVAQLVPQFRIVLDLFNVVRLKLAVTATVLTCITIATEHVSLPLQILGTTTPLILFTVLALRDPLALHPAINMGAKPFARSAYKDESADFTGEGLSVSPALLRTVHDASNMRRRARYYGSAVNTSDENFLRLSGVGTGTRTVALFRVFVPVPIGFFGDSRSACLARF